MTDDRSWARRADRLAAETKGEPTRWLTELWASAERDVQALPPSVRSQPVAGVRRLLAPGGTAIVELADLQVQPSPRGDRGGEIWVATLRRS